MPLTSSRRTAASAAAAALMFLLVCLAPGMADDAHALKQYGAKNYSWLGTASYFKVAGASNFYGSALSIPGPSVTRSRAFSGTQKVVVTRYLFKTKPTNWGELYNPWALEDSKTTYRLLAPGATASFSPWNLEVWPDFQYRVVMKVAYYTAGGRFLSSIYTDYNNVADYTCWTGNCSILPARDGRASITLLY